MTALLAAEADSAPEVHVLSVLGVLKEARVEGELNMAHLVKLIHQARSKIGIPRVTFVATCKKTSWTSENEKKNSSLTQQAPKL